MGRNRKPETTPRRELIDAGDVTIRHPRCGGEVLITGVAFEERGVRLEAICRRCDRYVLLMWRAPDPMMAGAAGVPRGVYDREPDRPREQVIEELEDLLTIEYLRAGAAIRAARRKE